MLPDTATALFRMQRYIRTLGVDVLRHIDRAQMIEREQRRGGSGGSGRLGGGDRGEGDGEGGVTRGGGWEERRRKVRGSIHRTLMRSVMREQHAVLPSTRVLRNHSSSRTTSGTSKDHRGFTFFQRRGHTSGGDSRGSSFGSGIDSSGSLRPHHSHGGAMHGSSLSVGGGDLSATVSVMRDGGLELATIDPVEIEGGGRGEGGDEDGDGGVGKAGRGGRGGHSAAHGALNVDEGEGRGGEGETAIVVRQGLLNNFDSSSIEV